MVLQKRKFLAFTSTLTFPFLLLANSSAYATLDESEADYELKLLGKYVFFDKISEPTRMACVSCHDPDTGGTGSVSGVNLHQVAITGANPHTVGSLKPPTNAYASFSPIFQDDGRNADGTNPPCGRSGVRSGGFRGFSFCGGNFWNGRAEGRGPTDFEDSGPEAGALGALFPPIDPNNPEPNDATKHIGDEIFYKGPVKDILLEAAYEVYLGATADQALNPMPNLVEQNIQRQAVCEQVASSKYAELYEDAWGEPIDCSNNPVTATASDVSWESEFDISFKRLMLAVCAWQASKDLNSFSSRRDIALANDADGEFPLDDFTEQENKGHDLFYGITSDLNPEGKNAGCSGCHLSDRDNRDGTGEFELYTDFAYHNIGVPENPELPAEEDPGLGGHTDNPDLIGGFKTPTLRNVDKRKDEDFIKAYAHNGWFKSLESIVHFYNTAFLGGAGPFGPPVPYEATTAYTFSIVRCTVDVVGHPGPYTEKEALANNCWPEPAWPATTAPSFIVGDLGLSAEEEAAIVAYLKTLTDTETPKAPKPHKSAKNNLH